MLDNVALNFLVIRNVYIELTFLVYISYFIRIDELISDKNINCINVSINASRYFCFTKKNIFLDD